jgi:hypothetical protein
MRTRSLLFLLSMLVTTSASAQDLMADMHRDVGAAEKKFIDLAQAIPESAYSWRPPGARSIGEVLMHIAADNYFLVIPMGKAAPEATKITADFSTTGAYEKRQLPKAQIIAELEASFKHLHEGMGLIEHLGQLIAYARSNNVAPPWSR